MMSQSKLQNAFIKYITSLKLPVTSFNNLIPKINDDVDLVIAEKYITKKYPSLFSRVDSINHILYLKDYFQLPNLERGIILTIDLKNKLKEVHFSNHYNIRNTAYLSNYLGNTTHPENIFEFGIKTKYSNILATFGCHIEIIDFNPALVFTGIQGKYGESRSLKVLSNKLGENWRVNVIKQLINHSKKNDFLVVGKVPYNFMASRDEYIRQVRQYIQTYLKAGLKKNEVDLSNIYDEQIELRFKKNLKNKRPMTEFVKKVKSKPKTKLFDKIRFKLNRKL